MQYLFTIKIKQLDYKFSEHAENEDQAKEKLTRRLYEIYNDIEFSIIDIVCNKTELAQQTLSK